MQKIAGLIILLFFCNLAFAQRISSGDRKMLTQKEDSMKAQAVKILQGINSSDRLKADSTFTRMFMRALLVKHSFYYRFDSLESISQLYAPDSSFRIFTWQLVINDNVIRQHGAIQMRTDDGSLKRFPLIDKSDITVNISDTIGNNKGWIGAVYYRIIQKKSFNKSYYTLLGFDENNIRSNRKIIEVLSFENEEPVFGGRYFSFEEDKTFKSSNSRFVMEYKKEAGPRLTYDPELDLIIIEHLVSESNEPNKKWTYIGDGDYEGFKWLNGKWVHIEKIYNLITPLGKEPLPNPIRDKDGNINESKLKGNEEEEKPDLEIKVKPKTVAPVIKKGNG